MDQYPRQQKKQATEGSSSPKPFLPHLTWSSSSEASDDFGSLESPKPLVSSHDGMVSSHDGFEGNSSLEDFVEEIFPSLSTTLSKKSFQDFVEESFADDDKPELNIFPGFDLNKSLLVYRRIWNLCAEGTDIRDVMRTSFAGVDIRAYVPRDPVTGDFLSLGSNPHLVKSCTLCMFFARRRCRKGELCLYCHFDHLQPYQPRRPSKKSRARWKKQREFADQNDVKTSVRDCESVLCTKNQTSALFDEMDVALEAQVEDLLCSGSQSSTGEDQPSQMSNIPSLSQSLSWCSKKEVAVQCKLDVISNVCGETQGAFDSQTLVPSKRTCTHPPPGIWLQNDAPNEYCIAPSLLKLAIARRVVSLS